MNNNETSNGLRFLIELRSRLIYTLLFLFGVFSLFLYFANNLYDLLALPLLKFLPQGRLIATQIVSPFFIPFKLAFFTSMMLSIPFFLYQLWSFIAPALYGHERRFIWPFLFASIMLFYSGMVFAYFAIFPALFHFLVGVAPSSVVLSPDISEYLDFTTRLLLVFGCLFEIPIIMMLLVASGITTRSKFIAWRSYAIVGAFIIGMLLAPPDVMSQTLLALPIWMLYESGIVLTKFIKKRKEINLNVE